MSTSSARPISETLQEYGRGITGGLLFALAPLYTMEIWWQGFRAPPEILLAAVVATYAVLVAYAYYAGLHLDRSLPYNAAEAFESIALGFLVAFVILKLLGQLPPDISTLEYVSRLTIEGLTSAIGVAVGSAQLGANPGDDEDDEKDAQGRPQKRGVAHEIAYSILGALIIVAGFTPTEEVMVSSLEAPVLAVLATALMSFLLALGIVSYFQFRGSSRHRSGVYAGGALGGAFVTYAVALVLSAALLWSVGRYDHLGLGAAICMTVYLALPATLGASVGRLLL